MNQSNQKSMQVPTTPAVTPPAASQLRGNTVLNSRHLQLEAFIISAQTQNLRGRSSLISEAQKFGIKKSYGSLITLIKKYKAEGPAALKRKDYKGKGDVRSFSNEAIRILQAQFTKPTGGVMKNAYEEMHTELRKAASSFVDSNGEEFQIINGFLCTVHNNIVTQQLSAMFVEGVYLISQNAVNNSHEVKVGSYKSACRYLASLQAASGDALFYNRFGVHDFRNKRQHTMKLNYSHLEPAHLIVGDGKQLDVIVISHDWRRVYRPYLFGWYDMATRRYCYSLGITETSEHIANSLSVAINSWGIPKIVKTDNGSAYKSGRFKEMCRFFNIEQNFATVKLARAKAIESFHNILDNLLKTQIGYTGNKYQEMPLDTKERLKLVAGKQRGIKKLDKFIKEDPAWYMNMAQEPEAKLKHSPKRFMHLSELIEVLDEKLAVYHERIHGGLQTDKLGKKAYSLNCKDELINEMKEKINTPEGRYEYHVKQGFKPVFADPGLVALYTTDFELRTVQIKTGINFNGDHFFNPKLAKFSGEKVLIRFTSIKADNIYIFHGDALQRISDRKQITKDIMESLTFLCIAERQKLIDYGDTDSYRSQLILQRAEESNIRASLGSSRLPLTKGEYPTKSGEGVSNIIQLTGGESTVEQIREEENIITTQKIKPVKSKLKSWSDID